MTVRGFMRASFFMACLLAAGSAECAVRAWLDNSAVSPGENIQLNLERDGQTSAEPDLSPLKQDFDVLGSSRSSSIQITNGNATSSVRLTLSLSPKHSGSLRIPALDWGSEKSDPIVINVSGNTSANPGASNSSGNSASVYLKTSIRPQRAYVQAGIELTVRIYAAVPLYNADLELPATSDVLVQQVGADKNETVSENGRRYQVIERHYEVFPQRSGSLSLPGPVLDAQIAVQDRTDPFGGAFRDLLGNLALNGFGSTKPIRVRGDDVLLTALPRPPGVGDTYWLPARNLTLQAKWRPDQGEPKVGDPVTLDLHLESHGLTAAQLPDLSALLKLPEGIKAYPDQPTLKNDASGATLTGVRDQSIALIADRAGDFTVPALSVHWWDTDANVEREATLPAHTLRFAPGATSSLRTSPLTGPAQLPSRDQSRGDRAPVSPKAVSSPGRGGWFWSSLVLAVVWLGTLVAWYFSRRGSIQPVPPENKDSASATEVRRRFREACRRDDARAARACLKEWLRLTSSTQQSINLHAFARRTTDPELRELLLELDRACFSGLPWKGESLLNALQELPDTPAKERRPPDPLLALYK
jgi:hypothetical protein